MDRSDIPQEIVESHRKEEIENMINENGWATGTVVTVDENYNETNRFDALIELLNGEGTGGRFSGVKYFAVIDGQLRESYAYGNKKSTETAHAPYAYVNEYDRHDVDYQPASPQTEGFNTIRGE